MATPSEEGDPNAPLLVLAEAPARVEMRLGRPLVGPSGDVFMDCLHAAGLIRRNCYILNIWPKPIDKDKAGNFSMDGEQVWTVSKGFTAYGLDAAVPTLRRIMASKCNAILSMGTQAMELLMDDHKKPIMKWRGSPLWSDRVKKKYIPTIHPAATIHGVYLWRYMIIGDMKKIQGELDSPELLLPKRTLHVRPTYYDFYQYIHKCREVGRVATDLEVVNEQISCFSLSCDKEEAMTVPLVGDMQWPGTVPYWEEDDEIRVWQNYAALMSDPEIEKINQNLVGFDAPYLFNKNHIHTKGKLGDPMIAQHVLYPDFRKGLDFIASVHTREPYWKDDGKIWKNPNIEWEQFQRYCGRDACVALEAWDVLSEEMTAGGYWPTYNRTVRLAGPLTYMSARGLEVDLEGLGATKAQIEQELAAKEAELREAAEWDFNVSSPAQCAKYFYETLGLKAYTKARGGITTDDKAMSRIVRKGGPGAKEAKLTQEVRSLRKLKGTYLEVELDPDMMLRCSWNPRGTWTGRLSSSQTIFNKGMNLQNLHPQFKGFIVARRKDAQAHTNGARSPTGEVKEAKVQEPGEELREDVQTETETDDLSTG